MLSFNGSVHRAATRLDGRYEFPELRKAVPEKEN